MEKKILNNKLYFGIDPGLDGGIVAINNNIVIRKLVIPTIKIGSKREYNIDLIIKFLNNFKKNSLAIIEKNHARPGQGVSSMYSMGYGAGLLVGLIAGLGFSYQLVRPQEWQKEIFKGIDKKGEKKASMIIAPRLFPNVDFRATERCKILHNGLTDACCIAEYGRRMNL